MGLFLFFDKCINKWLRFYRKKCFEAYIGQKCPGLQILGKIHMKNKNISMGKNVVIYPNVMFMGEGEISIGDNTFIQVNSIIYSQKGYKVSIGKDVMIAWNSYIINTDHQITLGSPMIRQGTVSGDVIIEDDVWIAGDVTILKGVRIASGSVIAAKALVNKDTDKNGIYAGIPAKLIRKRGEEF